MPKTWYQKNITIYKKKTFNGKILSKHVFLSRTYNSSQAPPRLDHKPHICHFLTPAPFSALNLKSAALFEPNLGYKIGYNMKSPSLKVWFKF